MDGLSCSDGYWTVTGLVTGNGERRSLKAKRVILAAGTLATARLVLKTLNHRDSVPMLSSPTAAFLLWLPGSLGAKKMPGFGLGQLSFTLSLRDETTAFGSTFSTTGILVSEFVRHIPMNRRYAIDLLKSLLSSCVVGNIFLPGQLADAEVKLEENGALSVSGNYSDSVVPLMDEARKKLGKAYRSLGALLLPGSFTIGRPGGGHSLRRYFAYASQTRHWRNNFFG